MNFQLMQPHPFNASGQPFKVLCVRCGAAKSSTDVVCDMDGKAGDFYCGHCAVCAEMDSKNE